MPMAVSSAVHPDRVRSLYKKVVKEVSAAAGPSGICTIESLDTACNAVDKKDNLLGSGGEYSVIILLPEYSGYLSLKRLLPCG